MQPSAIGEFGDFMDNLQVIKSLLVQKFLNSFPGRNVRTSGAACLRTGCIQSQSPDHSANLRDVQLEKASWLDNLILNISIQNVGVAFPLTHDEELQMPRSKSKESLAVRAFLFSIKAIDFTASRGETGHATMRRLCLQFVPKLVAFFEFSLFV